MSILFSEIYNKAILLFDDPKITVAYETNKIQYYKLMYSFLQNAIGMFHNPAVIATQLAYYNEPKGTMEVFEGNGQSSTFELSPEFEVLENSIYIYMQGDKKVTGKLEKVEKEVPVEVELEIETGEFDENGEPIIEHEIKTDGFIIEEVYQVTFPDVLPVGQQYAVEQYYCGEFTSTEFSGLNPMASNKANLISQQTKDILARLLVYCWAEEQRNDYLNVQDVLTDTDFKKTAAYHMLNANNAFITKLDREINEMQTRLAWTIRFGYSNSTLGRG